MSQIHLPTLPSSASLLFLTKMHSLENVDYLRQTGWKALGFIFGWYKSAAQPPNLSIGFLSFQIRQQFFSLLLSPALFLFNTDLRYLFWATLPNFLELHAIPICSKLKRYFGNSYFFKAGTTKHIHSPICHVHLIWHT